MTAAAAAAAAATTAVGQLVGKPLWCDVVGQKVERGR